MIAPVITAAVVVAVEATKANVLASNCLDGHVQGKFFESRWSSRVGCVCVCVVIPFILDVRHVDASTGVTQEEGPTGFLYLTSAVLVLTVIARRVQLYLPLVGREVDFLIIQY